MVVYVHTLGLEVLAIDMQVLPSMAVELKCAGSTQHQRHPTVGNRLSMSMADVAKRYGLLLVLPVKLAEILWRHSHGSSVTQWRLRSQPAIQNFLIGRQMVLRLVFSSRSRHAVLGVEPESDEQEQCR